MKKASVITMHRIYNYGSVLQTYATQKVLESTGVQCEIVDYISPYRAKRPLFLEYPSKLQGKRIKKAIYYIVKIPSFFLKDITFGGFIKKHINLSREQYITNADLIADPPKADIYITGSDQVWNSKYNHGVDGSYYLNFTEKDAKKIAFVTSFGRESLSAEEQEQVTPMLREYSSISVREDSAVQILDKMGLDSVCLIDPTLQVDKEEWLRLAANRKVKGKYLLLFLLYNEDNGAMEYAVKVAKEKNLKLVKLSWELKKPKSVDVLFTHRSPEVFLSLFANADCIVTNSFHGVAFSINLNRQFVFVPRSEFNGRIESLLRLTGLENRKVVDINNIDIVNEEVDYSEVNLRLNSEREKAKRFLTEVLK